MRDQLVDFLEGPGVEEQIDPLARAQLAGGMLALEAGRPATELGAAFEVFERFRGIQNQPYAFTAWTFSQSLRNFSSPMFVSGWLNI